MYLEEKEITGMYLGNQEISNAYVGTVEIYAKNQPTPTILYYCWRMQYMPGADYFYCYTNVKPVRATTTLYSSNNLHGDATSSAELVNSSTPGNLTNITDTSFKVPGGDFGSVIYYYYSAGDLYS